MPLPQIAVGTITPGPQDDDQLLTIREVAELLRVSPSWVYGRTRKRSLEQLPGYRLGKYWRFRRADVLSWLATRQTKLHRHE